MGIAAVGWRAAEGCILMNSELREAIIEPIEGEIGAAILYANALAWAIQNAKNDFALRFRASAQDEMAHAMQMIERFAVSLAGESPYGVEVYYSADVFDDLQSVLSTIVDAENEITESMRNILRLAAEAQDWQTVDFFVDRISEQEKHAAEYVSMLENLAKATVTAQASEPRRAVDDRVADTDQSI
ncbi:MAG: ferritin-like domain-containing protein [Planctomycetota bacterium]|nr:ferritin-like domain-containing protein [Planctomycetota bacterium]